MSEIKNFHHMPLNIQFFGQTQTTELNSPGNDLSPEMKVYYGTELIKNAEPHLAYGQVCDEYPIPKGKGKTIEFRKYDPLPKAMKPLVEGVTPVGNKLNASKKEATVKQYGDYIETSDLLEMTAIDPVILDATDLLASQAGRTIDTVDREVICAGTNVSFAPKQNAIGQGTTDVYMREDITASCRLTPKCIREAVAKLKRMNAAPRQGGDFVAIIHTDVTCDLTGDPEWLELHKYCRPEEAYKGEIGKLAGVRFIESTEAKIIGPGFIFGNQYMDGVSRMTLHTAIVGGTTDVYPEETISPAQAAELTQRISAGETVKIYVGGKETSIRSVTAGDAGTGKFVVADSLTNIDKGAVICGYGAGKDGSAVYCTMIIGKNACGTTEISGMGLRHITKQLGSAGSGDPLDQRGTVGWKCSRVTERLVEAYMVRIEHSTECNGSAAESN